MNILILKDLGHSKEIRLKLNKGNTKLSFHAAPCLASKVFSGSIWGQIGLGIPPRLILLPECVTYLGLVLFHACCFPWQTSHILANISNILESPFHLGIHHHSFMKWPLGVSFCKEFAMTLLLSHFCGFWNLGVTA